MLGPKRGRGGGRGRWRRCCWRQRRRSCGRVQAGNRRYRLSIGPDRGRHRLGVRTGVSRLEIDDVTQENLGFVELVTPNDDRLEGQRALAQPRNHRLAAGFDALGDRDFAFAREQLDRPHLAQIHADRVISAFAGLGLFGLCRR